MSHTKKQTETELDELISKPYILWLINDTKNTFQWVIQCLINTFGYDEARCENIANTVHFRGKCDVKHGDKEELEEYENILIEFGLTAKIELA